MRYFKHSFLFLTALLCCLTIMAEAKVICFPSSNHLVTDETSYLTYVIEPSSTKIPLQPKINIPEATCELHSKRTFRQNGKLLYQLTYRFKATKQGVYTVPQIVFSRDNNDISVPITLTVKEQTTLKKQQILSTTLNKADGSNKPRETYPYYTQLVAFKSSLFPNEVTQLEYKIYLPRSLKIAQWGLPTGEKVNATAWRFETPRAGILNGAVKIDGINYQVGTFNTTVSGIKPGKASIGPFKNRMVHTVPLVGQSGLRAETQKMHLESGIIHLDIRDLPPNPPANFKGDVGTYSMSLDIETRTEISSSESIKAKVILNGSGKLSELSPPELTGSEHWKLISQSKRELGNRRKSITGFAEFDYLIQPTNTGPATSTPGFSFSYLDPHLEDYKTISYPGIPIKINLNSSLDSDLNHSFISNNNQMLGIIEDITPNKLTWFKTIPISFIHLIPALICLFLILILIKRKYRAYRLNQSHKVIQSRTLKEMAEKQDEDFLKAATNYIQRWVDIEKHPELKEIEEFRDNHCYQPDNPVKISANRKQSIIHALQKIMILLLCFTPYLADASTLANDFYKQEKYDQALTEFQSKFDTQHANPSADLLYNIGNCLQKLNQPAKAAIHYHRALNIDPYHTRSLHNLTIIQNQHHSIIANTFIKKNSLAYWLNYLSPTTYYIVMCLSLWLIAISLLWIFILKPVERTKIFLISASLVALCLAILTYYAQQEHPNTDKISSSSFAVIANTCDLLEQPIESSSSIIEIPTASECRVITTSGTYSYIELTDINKSKGWILTNRLLKLIEP